MGYLAPKLATTLPPEGFLRVWRRKAIDLGDEGSIMVRCRYVHAFVSTLTSRFAEKFLVKTFLPKGLPRRLSSTACFAVWAAYAVFNHSEARASEVEACRLSSPIRSFFETSNDVTGSMFEDTSSLGTLDILPNRLPYRHSSLPAQADRFEPDYRLQYELRNDLSGVPNYLFFQDSVAQLNGVAVVSRVHGGSTLRVYFELAGASWKLTMRYVNVQTVEEMLADVMCLIAETDA